MSLWGWDGMGEHMQLLQPYFTSHQGPEGSLVARKGHLDVQSNDLQQSMFAGSVLGAQGMNQPSPMGPGRVRRKSGCFSPGLICPQWQWEEWMWWPGGYLGA